MSNSPYPSDDATRSSLVEGIKDPANRKYWERFYELYAGILLNVAYKKGIRNQDAQDILQETMFDITLAITSFRYDRSKGSFRGWIKTIMLRRLYDAYRKAQRAKLCFVEAVDETTWNDASLPKPKELLEQAIDEEWITQIQEESLKRLREEVSVRQFEVFDACEMNNWPTAQVMQVYGISRDVVYQTRRRTGLVFNRIVREVSSELDNPSEERSHSSPNREKL